MLVWSVVPARLPCAAVAWSCSPCRCWVSWSVPPNVLRSWVSWVLAWLAFGGCSTAGKRWLWATACTTAAPTSLGPSSEWWWTYAHAEAKQTHNTTWWTGKKNINTQELRRMKFKEEISPVSVLKSLFSLTPSAFLICRYYTSCCDNPLLINRALTAGKERRETVRVLTQPQLLWSVSGTVPTLKQPAPCKITWPKTQGSWHEVITTLLLHPLPETSTTPTSD